MVIGTRDSMFHPSASVGAPRTAGCQTHVTSQPEEPAMKSVSIFAALACLLLAAQTARAEGEDDVKQRVEAFAKAFNAHDAKAMDDFFTDDGDMVDVAGKEYVGKEKIGEQLSALEAGVDKEATTTVDITRVKMLKPEVALIDWTANVTNMKDESGKASSGKFLVTLVMVQHEGKWMVASCRTTRVVQ